MIGQMLPHALKLRRRGYTSLRIPSRNLEYAYYFAVFYSIFSTVMGLSIPLLAPGMLWILAALCMSQVRLNGMRSYAPIISLLGCAISFLLVQILIHGETLNETHRAFITWIPGLVIVQTLCLRQGFLHRFSIVIFLIGVLVLPYLTLDVVIDVVDRARVELDVGGNLSHPNGLADWFGFCAVYFTIFGFETKRSLIRLSSWLAAVLSLFVVGLTVSRGALIAVAVAIIVALRRVLKRGFVPALVLIVFAWLGTESGIFRTAISNYAERGAEDTGRLQIWPAALERILNSPIVGVGESNIGTYVPEFNQMFNPHNAFIFLALSSGLLPLVFFLDFWVRGLWMSLSRPEQTEKSPYRASLLIYTFAVVLLGDVGYMAPWALLAISAGTSESFLSAARFHVARISKTRPADQAPHTDLGPKATI